MIRVASIGYGLKPEFLLKAPSQLGIRAFDGRKRGQTKAKL